MLYGLRDTDSIDKNDRPSKMKLELKIDAYSIFLHNSQNISRWPPAKNAMKI